MTAAMIGGTASRATGGKFANGAATSAVSWMLNAESNVSKWEKQKEQKDVFSAKLHVGKLKLGFGFKRIASVKASLSLNATEQVEGTTFRKVNGAEISGELRGVEYKLIDIKEYNNNEILVNKSLSKNITVLNFNISDQDIILKLDVGIFLLGVDTELNMSEAVRRISK